MSYPALSMSCLVFIVTAPALAQEVTPPPADKTKEDKRQDDLADKLIKQATGQSDEDIMQQIMELMADTEKRLSDSGDSGETTQSLQQAIIKRMDTAIEQALAQRRPRKSPPGGESSPDKRNLPQPSQPQGQPQEAGSEAAQSGGDPGTTESKEPERQRAKLLGELLESRRSWGNLPARDREEIIQGAQEDVVERYRPMIERYYQALAESEDEE